MKSAHVSVCMAAKQADSQVTRQASKQAGKQAGRQSGKEAGILTMADGWWCCRENKTLATHTNPRHTAAIRLTDWFLTGFADDLAIDIVRLVLLRDVQDRMGVIR